MSHAIFLLGKKERETVDKIGEKQKSNKWSDRFRCIGRYYMASMKNRWLKEAAQVYRTTVWHCLSTLKIRLKRSSLENESYDRKTQRIRFPRELFNLISNNVSSTAWNLNVEKTRSSVLYQSYDVLNLKRGRRERAMESFKIIRCSDPWKLMEAAKREMRSRRFEKENYYSFTNFLVNDEEAANI